MNPPFFTIGHSTRSVEAFVELLRGNQVDHLLDIRTVPRSRTNPQFNQDSFPTALAEFHISYEHVQALGGLRGRSRGTPLDVNGFWTNESFHNYADYALSPQFHEGFQHLVDVGRRLRCAIMCSEAVWWRCHRRIVADYLIAHGETVFHIMGPQRVEIARLTPSAEIQASGSITYPAETSESLPSDGLFE